MWQRLQTIFLALVVIALVAAMFFPIWRHVDSAGVRYELFPLHYSVVDGDQKTTAYLPYALTAIFMVAAATVAIQTIRRYDNRLLQLKLCLFNTLLLMGVMVCAVVFSYQLNAQFNVVGISRGELWILFAGVAFNWIATRLIKRDEKIVRDSDRLR